MLFICAGVRLVELSYVEDQVRILWGGLTRYRRFLRGKRRLLRTPLIQSNLPVKVGTVELQFWNRDFLLTLLKETYWVCRSHSADCEKEINAVQSACNLLSGLLLGLLMDPEDEGDMFLRNIVPSPIYTALQPRILYFS
jgi:hypothetical protein